MKNLKLNDYDCIDDIISEALETLCGIKKYSLEDVLINNSSEEFVCGTITIVKGGKDNNHLKHKCIDGTWIEAQISDSYKNSEYYKLSELEILLPKLSRKGYNNSFFKVIEL